MENERGGMCVRLENGGTHLLQSVSCMTHCNGGHFTTLTPVAEVRQIISMEEVTCKLRGIQVGKIAYNLFVHEESK
ncbi:hypothetical protein DPMN_100711 [Dreissena polymorpha]|uniref:Uncharacterized protein n=1 Tax=Dreissena polymorpha TaxID=45954 RepID=A0A9D4R8X0_DREPO|nr:hypothetical protein DPMN_100711 [Dreissena polymorpha]